MEKSIAEILSGWHDFYMLAGVAAATLSGLLFISVSIHLDLVIEKRAEGLRSIAAQTLGNFVYVLVIALVMIIPELNREGFGITLGIFGLFGMARSLLRIIDAFGSRFGGKPKRIKAINTIIHIFGPAICYLGLSGAALVVVIDPALIATVMYWMVAIIIYLLVESTLNAWNMMVGLGLLRQRRLQNNIDEHSAENIPEAQAQPVANS